MALAVWAGGCASTPSRPPEIVPPSNRSERTLEAMRLAQAAQTAANDGRTRDAVELYKQSLDHSTDLWSVWNNLGLLYMQLGNYPDAANMFIAAADRAPREPRPLENLGILYHRRGYEREALSYFNQALEREPNYLPALRGAMVSAKRLGVADKPALERVRRGLLLENDPTWLRVFRSEQIRLENAVKGRGRQNYEVPEPGPEAESPAPELAPEPAPYR